MTRSRTSAAAAGGGAAAAVVGAVTGFLGTAAHSSGMPAGPVLLPVGLAVAVGLAGSADLALRLAGGRVLPLLSGATRLVVVLVLASPRPEGDLLLAGTGRGTAWLLMASLLPVLVATWPAPRATAPPALPPSALPPSAVAPRS